MHPERWNESCRFDGGLKRNGWTCSVKWRVPLKPMKTDHKKYPCRTCGRPVYFTPYAWNKRIGRFVYGNPVLVIHVDGCACDDPGQLMLPF